MSRDRFKCIDCDIDTGRIGEHYMLKDEIWNLVHNSKDGMLCISCLESRLGRKLKKSDFNQSHINKPLPGKMFSNKLIDRLYNES